MKDFHQIINLIQSWQEDNVQLACQLLKGNKKLQAKFEELYAPLLTAFGEEFSWMDDLIDLPDKIAYSMWDSPEQAIQLPYSPKMASFIGSMPITELIEDGSGFTVFPWWITKLKNLTTLEFDSNSFTTLPNSIRQLQQLEHLVLGYELSELPIEIGELTALKSLYLTTNALKELPPSIGQLRQLNTLHIAGNKLISLPEEIGELHSLEKLYTGGNQLTSLPRSIGQLQNLKYLHLPDNKLVELPPEIGKLRSLKDLN